MEYIFAGGIASSLITAFLLLSSPSTFPRFANFLFSLYLIGGSYCALLFILVNGGYIAQFPHLFKTAAPVNFVLPPLSYFYVRAILKDQTFFRKGDFAHFFPALLVFVSYVFFYFLPAAEKLQFISAASKKVDLQVGILSEGIIFYGRQLQAGVYVVLQWTLIIRFVKSGIPLKLRAFTNSVLNWLRAITLINTIHFLSFFVIAIIWVSNTESLGANSLKQASLTLFALGYFVLTSYLLLNPSVLYGLDSRYSEAESNTSKSFANKAAKLLDDEEEVLRQYFEEKMPYLQPNLTISEVSVATGIPVRSISFILNSQQGFRFTDFVNMYRVQAAAKEIEAGFLERYTIASLADKTGFSSVRSFNRAFQRHFNQTPSSYSVK